MLSGQQTKGCQNRGWGGGTRETKALVLDTWSIPGLLSLTQDCCKEYFIHLRFIACLLLKKLDTGYT